MNSIDNQQQIQDEIAQDKYTIMKFDATWCPDYCKNVDRFIGDISSMLPRQRSK
ncbi:thioredoxin domain-containing protein [Paenibacillus glycinis]|uniref:Uncharacterized protein n=1 Tax=Paenibacillus glycinis TaxID=2697035 RepID=A0ABW9XZ60_9BACL|nr:hypothetical protein [Paenibacillus glycinis]NBD28013.1 hypothetical protein [Paenibacillus glycinis]